MRSLRAFALGLMVAACSEAPEPLVYQAVPVERRDIVVSAQAAGVVEPDVTVEVKSKASGEILEVVVDSGDLVERGTLLVRIDQRQPRNTLAQADAELEVAYARLANAEAQRRRAEGLFKSRSIPETEYEQALLDHANAKAGVVRARVAVENAQIQMDDTEILAPIDGTIIEKNAERGQVISSPIQAVSGGTVLLKMADLDKVQVRTLVDETDIGKIGAGLPASVTVAAYPNRPFYGTVLKIEPQAETLQNVTMFPVLVSIENREGLLRPGMNCEVEIHVGRRTGVLALPNAALRTREDVVSAAMVLGLSMDVVQAQLASGQSDRRALAGNRASVAAGRADADDAQPATITLPDGRELAIPVGVPAERVRAILAKFRRGERPSADERSLLRRLRQGNGGGVGDAVNSHNTSAVFGGDYIVFVLRDGAPYAVNVRVGLTDLDYSEVIEGLTESNSVLLLPSADLVQAQDRFRERIDRMRGGVMPGMRSRGR